MRYLDDPVQSFHSLCRSEFQNGHHQKTWFDIHGRIAQQGSLNQATQREPQGIEMGPRASSA